MESLSSYLTISNSSYTPTMTCGMNSNGMWIKIDISNYDNLSFTSSAFKAWSSYVLVGGNQVDLVNTSRQTTYVYFEIPLTTNDIGKSIAFKSSGTKNDFLYIQARTNTDMGINFKITINVSTVPSEWFNSSPTINGSSSQNINLGEKNQAFNITYSVNDANEDDVLTVKEYLDGTVLKTRSNALRNTNYTIDISKDKLYSLSQDSYHTISVSVSDGSSETTTTWKFIRVNSAPEITASSDISSDSVFKANSPAITYSLHDAEGDNCYASFKLDSDTILQEKTLVTQDTSLSFSISHSQWILIPNGEHKITLIAEDELGAQDTKDFTFTKAEDTIIVYLKNPVTTTVSAIKALIMPVWVINSASVKVEVCNNANDTSPTWEDITTEVLQMKSHAFTNDTKTADEWGGNVRITMIRTNTTGAVELNGFGGSIV